MMRIAVAGREISAAATCRRSFGGPISTGPPTPPWIRLTRRRISARMMRSPRSASATSSARNCSGGNQQRFDIAFGMAVDQRDAAGELADLGEELARPLIDHRRDMAEAVALGDRDMAGQHDEHAGPGLAGLEQHFAVPVSCAISPNRRMRAISCGVSAGKVCSRRGNAAAGAAAVSLCLRSWSLRHQPSQGQRRYSRAIGRLFFRLLAASSAGMWQSSPWKATASSLRPLACDFRRLRFSRNASFSRSCRASFFACPPVWPSPFPCHPSSWTRRMDAPQRISPGEWPMGENHALAPLPQRTLAGWHRFVASGDPETCGRYCRNILCFARRSCIRRFRGGLRPFWY